LEKKLLQEERGYKWEIRKNCTKRKEIPQETTPNGQKMGVICAVESGVVKVSVLKGKSSNSRPLT